MIGLPVPIFEVNVVFVVKGVLENVVEDVEVFVFEILLVCELLAVDVFDLLEDVVSLELDVAVLVDRRLIVEFPVLV
jgi:hypothetical protein